MCSTCRAPSRERSPREKDVSVPGRNPRAGGSLPLPAPLCPLVLLGRAGAQEERRRQDRAVSQWSQNNLDRGLPPARPPPPCTRAKLGDSRPSLEGPWRILHSAPSPPVHSTGQTVLKLWLGTKQAREQNSRVSRHFQDMEFARGRKRRSQRPGIHISSLLRKHPVWPKGKREEQVSRHRLYKKIQNQQRPPLQACIKQRVTVVWQNSVQASKLNAKTGSLRA